MREARQADEWGVGMINISLLALIGLGLIAVTGGFVMGRVLAPRIDAPEVPGWVSSSMAPVPAAECPPEMATLDQLVPDCVFKLTDGIFDWDLWYDDDLEAYTGSIRGKGWQIDIAHKDSKKALDALENARKHLMRRGV